MRFLKVFIIINVFAGLLFCPDDLFSQEKYVVVLDAGHGGKDPGAVSGKNYEKDINLAVVQVVGRALEEMSSVNIEVIYTRSDDTFVELDQRSKIAIDANASLFVSVHTNASDNRQAYGSDTFVMGVDKNNANLEVAMRENGVISLERDFTQKYEGYDPTSAESHIMFTLTQYAHQQQSLSLARMVQDNFVAAKRRDRGVKQAGFLVLWRNTMPSVLVELGFISNEKERSYLMSTKGREEMGLAIAKAIRSYIEQNADSGHKYIEQDGQHINPPTTDHNVYGPAIANDTKQENRPTTTTEAHPQDEEPNDNTVYEAQKPQTNIGVYYAIQLRSSRKQLSIDSKNFGPLVMLTTEHLIGKQYKYTVGELFVYNDAKLLLQKIKNIFSDAFIVAFDNNGEQISVSNAKKLTEK